MTSLNMLLISGMQFLGVLIGKTVEFFMQDLMGHHSRSMQDRDVGNLNCGDLVQDQKKNISK